MTHLKKLGNEGDYDLSCDLSIIFIFLNISLGLLYILMKICKGSVVPQSPEYLAVKS